MRRSSGTLFIILALYVSGYSQDLNTFDLGGKWKFRQLGDSVWRDAEVPGCVHLDLMKNGLILDPFYRDNEASLQWIGEASWEYQRAFQCNEKDLQWNHIELVCKGLDTYARIYLNDTLVLSTDNMFLEWYIDLKRYLRTGTNMIRIQFVSPVLENKERYARLDRKLPGDEKVVCRKAAYHFGWDWGPTLITSGIWRPVYIRFWDQVNVLGAQYIQKGLTDSLATVSAVIWINSPLRDSADISVCLDSVRVIDQRIGLGKSIVTIFRKDFQIVNPRRWWPNGMGSPNLYYLTFTVTVGKKIVGRGYQRMGFRTVELIQSPDESGKSFYFKVNGLPVFMKGANYIPQDNFIPRVKDSTYRALIKDVKEANMNMLRVWGGGIYENDIFYDLCDENGIMVWQDFMFACAMYPGDKGFQNSVRAEAMQNIVRLRRHPCLALWCGNNEIDEGWKNWGWQKQYGYSKDDSAKVYWAYRNIFNEVLPNNVKWFDTLRPYIPTSPLIGWGRQESMKQGDSHYWGVWWGKEPFSIYRQKVGRFMSEYGFQGFPDISTIRKFTLPEDRELGSSVMKMHQKHPVGFETIDEYLLRDFKKPKDFESYAMVSQLLQAEGMKTAIEAHRRGKPYCMGTLYWQLNDCWPVVSWSSRDSYGKKKALHYWIRNLYDRILVSPVVENNHVRIWIISDVLTDEKATLTLTLTGFQGNILMRKELPVVISANSSQVYFDTLKSSILSGHDSNNVVLVASISTNRGFTQRNLLYFSNNKDLLLTQPLIETKVTKVPEGYQIQLITDKLAKNVHISVETEGDFSDNYFDLLPGDKKDIIFSTRQKIRNFSSLMHITTLVDSY